MLKPVSISLGLAALALLSACGEKHNTEHKADAPAAPPAAAAQTAPADTRSDSEKAEHAASNVVRAVFLCENGERLTADFDNPRNMATIRNSTGEAVDLAEQPAASGIWYKSSQAELRGKGDNVTWTVEGRQPTECRSIS